jgi:pimeloyl-ACP methyl ester carboxylesterase
MQIRSTWRRGVGILALATTLAAAIGVVAASSAPTVAIRHCGPGATAATIGGKHVCLRRGQRCAKSRDRAYHRYRFHCHSGRLTRFPAAPQPARPPTLAEPPAPAGQLVDVGGYRLHLECAGTGSPTVVLEPGATATRILGRKVQYALSSETRVCSYDRPGTTTGGPSASDPRPPGVAPTSETFARELSALLVNANIPGPYVLAGASFGGLLISAFTARYPDAVAGLVFVDALAPGSAEGFVRVGGSPEPWDGSGDLDRLRALNFGNRPVVALTTQSPGEIPDLRRRSTNILVAEAPQYSHFVFVETPGLAYEAIRVAVAAVRSGGALPSCARTPLARLATRCTP